MSHMWMRHVTHMNGSYHTWEWVMSHMWMSHVAHVNESCYPHMNRPCHTNMNGPCHTYSCPTHMNVSCHTHENVFSHILLLQQINAASLALQLAKATPTTLAAVRVALINGTCVVNPSLNLCTNASAQVLFSFSRVLFSFPRVFFMVFPFFLNESEQKSSTVIVQ